MRIKQLLFGRYVMKENLRMVNWYRKAAEQGNADAMKALAECYYEGKGVEQSYTEAAAWRAKADR